jgi:glucokinase
MTGWRLVSDVGGTNVRFARAAAGNLFAYRAHPVSRFPSFAAALRAYLDETGGAHGCLGAAIGAAGPVNAGKVSLTNLAWDISEAEVSSVLGAPCKLLNDVEAVAFSVPGISAAGFAAIGTPSPNLSALHRILVANIGTGFGAATLIRSDGGWVSCPSEAGHMSLAFPDWEDPSLARLFPSVEHVLSGRGLANLYAGLSKSSMVLAPNEVLNRPGPDPHADATLLLLTKIAGNVLGNLVLATAAWDGVFLCGSVARNLVKNAGPAIFREAFEGIGPRNTWLRRVPVALLTEENPALLGLAVLPLPSAL